MYTCIYSANITQWYAELYNFWLPWLVWVTSTLLWPFCWEELWAWTTSTSICPHHRRSSSSPAGLMWGLPLRVRGCPGSGSSHMSKAGLNVTTKQLNCWWDWWGWVGLGPEPSRAWPGFGIWYPLLQWAGSYMLPSKCWALCTAFQVSQTASQFQRKLLVIKVFGHIFLREHSKCMTQVPSSSAAALKISAAAPASPARVGWGCPFVHQLKANF